MKFVRLIFIQLLLLAGFTSTAQQADMVREYIEQYKDLAMAEMQRTGVPAAIKLAQGIHESSAGASRLATKANNHFGIKCKADWMGQSISHDDDARGECFRKYLSAEDSYKDHSNFLKKSSRYASLFELDPTDYEGWAYGLKKAGYATNPRYPQVIIKLIEDYGLQDYTMIAMGKMPATNETLVSNKDPEQKTEETVQTTTPVIIEETIKAPEQPVYPEGVFSINETRVVFVKSGTSWLSIAQEHSISLSRLFDFNDMEQGEVIEKDQLVYLQRKRKTGNNEFHIVRAGENLHDIAQQQAIRLEALLEYNMLDPGMRPAIGERLYLRGKAPVMPRVVQRETLSSYPAKWNNNQN
ncbi:MAG TPA: glucosaminidase domain-containing protein [Chitinophagaceae bacterium]